MCGELTDKTYWARKNSGSSPRVRGTRSRRGPPDLEHRFIPACAGNSISRDLERYTGAVHPRVCGELPVLRADEAARRRFIPACAGNSSSRGSLWSASTVHPRVCGELDGSNQSVQVLGGSSPRVRGTLRGVRAFGSASRFIPACAGNSLTPSCGRRATAVHPRVCGELDVLLVSEQGEVGSSPRVRGTRRNRRVTVVPRIGSSPRVRGTRWRRGVVVHDLRFIPACAGNSPPTWRAATRSTVHPRVCGELSAPASLVR